MLPLFFAILTLLVTKIGTRITLYVDPIGTICPIPSFSPLCPFHNVSSALSAINFFDKFDIRDPYVTLFLKEGNIFTLPVIDKDMRNFLLFEICAYSLFESNCSDYSKRQMELPIITLYENTYVYFSNVVIGFTNLKFSLRYNLNQSIQNIFYFKNGSVTITSAGFENGTVSGSEIDNSIIIAVDCDLKIREVNFFNNTFSNITTFTFSSTPKPISSKKDFKTKPKRKMAIQGNPSYIVEFSKNMFYNNLLTDSPTLKVTGIPGGLFLINDNNFTDNRIFGSYSFLLDINDIQELQFNRNILRANIREVVLISLIKVYLTDTVEINNNFVYGNDSKYISQIYMNSIATLKLENTTFSNELVNILLEEINDITILNTIFFISRKPHLISLTSLLVVTGYLHLEIDNFIISDYETSQSLFELRDCSPIDDCSNTEATTILKGLRFSNISGDISVEIFRKQEISITDSTFQNITNGLFQIRKISYSNVTFSNCNFKNISNLNILSNKPTIFVDGAWGLGYCMMQFIIEDSKFDGVYCSQGNIFHIPSSCAVKNVILSGLRVKNTINQDGGIIAFTCSRLLSRCPESFRVADSIFDLSNDWVTTRVPFNTYISIKNVDSLTFLQSEEKRKLTISNVTLELESLIFVNINELLGSTNEASFIMIIYPIVDIYDMSFYSSRFLIDRPIIFELKGQYISIEEFNMYDTTLIYNLDTVKSKLFKITLTNLISNNQDFSLSFTNCEFENISLYLAPLLNDAGYYIKYYNPETSNFETNKDDGSLEVDIIYISFDNYNNETFENDYIVLDNVVFQESDSNNQQMHFLRMDYMEHMQLVLVKNSKFTDLKCLNGCVFKCSIGNVTIDNSIFTLNNAKSEGGVIYNELCNFTIKNSYFSNNIAGYGDIYSSNPTLNLINKKIYTYWVEALVLVNNTFIYDFTDPNFVFFQSSGLFYFNNHEAFVNNCTFSTNNLKTNISCKGFDNHESHIRFNAGFTKGNGFNIGMYQDSFYKKMTSFLLKINSAKASDSKVRAEFYFDHYFAWNISETTLYNQSSSEGENTFILEVGTDIATKKRLVILGFANEYQNSLRCSSISTTNDEGDEDEDYATCLFLFVAANLNQCNAGQWLDTSLESGYKCNQCSSGSYTLPGWDSLQCLPCPIYASCDAGVITPIKNYWRSSPNTDRIYFCYSQPDVCLGGVNSTCLAGYTGTLCKACDIAKGYVQSGNKECGICGKNIGMQIFIFSLMFLIFLVIEIYLLNSELRDLNYMAVDSIESAFEKKKQVSIYLNSLLTYVQILTLMQFFNFNIPQQITLISSIFVDPSSQIVYSQYCFLYQMAPSGHLVFMNFGFLLACSITRLFILIIFWLYFLVYRWKKAKKSQFLTVIASWAIIEYIIIFREWFLLSCIEIDGTSYIQKDFNYICTKNYMDKFVGVIFPTVTVLILSIPVLFLLILIKYRHNLGEQKYIHMLGSLYLGTRLKVFYWNIIFFFFKLFIVAFGAFTQSDSNQVLGLFSLFLLFALVSYILKPYNKKQLNSLNLWSVCVYLLTISFAQNKSLDSIYRLVRYSRDSSVSTQLIDIISTIFILVINFCFALFLVVKILIYYSRKLKRIYNNLKQRYYNYRLKQAEKVIKPEPHSTQEEGNILDPLFFSANFQKKSQSVYHSYQDDSKHYNELKSPYYLMGNSSYPPKTQKKINKDIERKMSISLEKTPSRVENMNISEDLFKSKDE